MSLNGNRRRPVVRFSLLGDNIIPLGSILLAIVIVVQTCTWVIRYRDVFPFYDMILVDYRYFTATARDFWIFHDNEHLPLFAMPLFWTDLRVFGGQGLFLVLCNLLLAGAIASVPCFAIRAGAEGRVGLAVIGASVIASMMFWLGNRTNLVWPKQTHMYLSLFALMPAFARAASDRVVKLGAITLISGWLFLATFSFGYGIIGFPCVGFIAIARRWEWRSLTALALTFMITLWLYLNLTGGFSYFVSEGAPLLSNRISSGLAYALTFVAAPLISVLRAFSTETVARTAAWIVTALAIALIAFRMLLALWRRPDRLEAWALLLAMFTLGNAAETAFARAARFGFEQALEYRYVLGELPFWIALVLLTLRGMVGVPRRLFTFAGAALLTLEVTLLISQRHELQHLRSDSAVRWQAAMAALDGVDDRSFFEGRVWPDPDQVTTVVNNLRTHQLSMFAWHEAAWLGQSIGSFVDGGTCTGALDEVQPVAGTVGSKVRGWTDDKRVSAESAWILLADPAGIVLGVAHGGEPRPDLFAARHKDRFKFAGWLGYVPLQTTAAELTAYLALPGQRVCRLGRNAVPAS